ncbi:hypothetical protein OIE62_00925 [Streptomyces scopuliridis]|uniref:Uncharacterized protein n=1 Tax=Streptomyces scopuliridis TaxID=452529 RepID=A0ACD4ZY24_9ACTN|nr:hypothetical protein [Streptomyces scopuliridis]WSC03443.1 hypothetical protein OG835_40910 [Streptomyces scopuliridis]WSC11262.1 hypothetical protein OIE62_00925 [Streptomyces scopuliridis]
MVVDAEAAVVDLAGTQLHQFLGGLGQRRLLDDLADCIDALADLGADFVGEQVDTGFHDFVLTDGVACRADRLRSVLTNTRCRPSGPCDSATM